MIKKGEVYLCLEDVIMSNSKKVAYIKGKLYSSNVHTALTDEQKDDYHYWGNTDGEFNRYFVKHSISEVNNNYLIF